MKDKFSKSDGEITIEDFEVERGDVVASVGVVIIEMSRGVDVSGCVDAHLHFSSIETGAVFDTGDLSKELAAETCFAIPDWGVGSDTV